MWFERVDSPFRANAFCEVARCKKIFATFRKGGATTTKREKGDEIGRSARSTCKHRVGIPGIKRVYRGRPLVDFLEGTSGALFGNGPRPSWANGERSCIGMGGALWQEK